MTQVRSHARTHTHADRSRTERSGSSDAALLAAGSVLEATTQVAARRSTPSSPTPHPPPRRRRRLNASPLPRGTLSRGWLRGRAPRPATPDDSVFDAARSARTVHPERSSRPTAPSHTAQDPAPHTRQRRAAGDSERGGARRRAPRRPGPRKWRWRNWGARARASGGPSSESEYSTAGDERRTWLCGLRRPPPRCGLQGVAAGPGVRRGSARRPYQRPRRFGWRCCARSDRTDVWTVELAGGVSVPASAPGVA